MRLDIILKKQSNRDTDYIHFLLNYVPVLVGSRTWRNHWLTSDLNQYFTNSEKAFLLLCYKSYGAKWLHDYNATITREWDEEDTAPHENIPVNERYPPWVTTMCLPQNTIGVSKSILTPGFVLRIGGKIYGVPEGYEAQLERSGQGQIQWLDGWGIQRLKEKWCAF